MSVNQNPKRTIAPRSSGFLQDFTDRFRLIGRLIMDRRVHPLVKVLPIASLAYVVWPIDVPGPIDDALVVWLGTSLFVELCPPDVVDEHLADIRRRGAAQAGTHETPATQEADVIDGEYYESDPNNRRGTSSR